LCSHLCRWRWRVAAECNSGAKLGSSREERARCGALLSAMADLNALVRKYSELQLYVTLRVKAD